MSEQALNGIIHQEYETAVRAQTGAEKGAAV